MRSVGRSISQGNIIDVAAQFSRKICDVSWARGAWLFLDATRVALVHFGIDSDLNLIWKGYVDRIW